MISSWIEYLTVRSILMFINIKKAFLHPFESAHHSTLNRPIFLPHSSVLIIYPSTPRRVRCWLIHVILCHIEFGCCVIMLHRWSEFPVRSLVTTQKLARWTGKKCPGYERRKEKHHRSARSLRKTAGIITGELPQLREEIGNTMKTKVAHFSFHNRLYSLATGEINFDLIEIVRGDRWSSWWWKRRPTSTGSN